MNISLETSLIAISTNTVIFLVVIFVLFSAAFAFSSMIYRVKEDCCIFVKKRKKAVIYYKGIHIVPFFANNFFEVNYKNVQNILIPKKMLSFISNKNLSSIFIQYHFTDVEKYFKTLGCGLIDSNFSSFFLKHVGKEIIDINDLKECLPSFFESIGCKFLSLNTEENK